MNELRFNVIACSQKTSKTGKTYYRIGIALNDGSLIELVSFNAYEVGQEIVCVPAKRVIGNMVIAQLVVKNEK